MIDYEFLQTTLGRVEIYRTAAVCKVDIVEVNVRIALLLPLGTKACFYDM